LLQQLAGGNGLAEYLPGLSTVRSGGRDLDVRCDAELEGEQIAPASAAIR
jgi:hypothetical protein